MRDAMRRFRTEWAVPLVAAALAVASATAFAGECGMGNQCPVLDGFQANPGVFGVGQTGQLVAQAHDPDGVLTRYDFSAAAGAFPNGTAQQSVATAATTASIAWTAPSTPGTYAVTVRVYDNGGFMGVPSSGSVSTATLQVVVQVTNSAPVITSLTAAAPSVFIGQSTDLAATVTDPDGDPVTLAWSASGGTVAPNADPYTALFTAAPVPGMALVTLTATDSKGAATSRALSLAVVDVLPEHSFGGFLAPASADADSYGVLYVVDSPSGTLSALNLSDGGRLKSFAGQGLRAVAVDWADRLVVGGAAGAEVWDRAGRALFALRPLGPPGPVQAVAVDRTARRYYTLDAAAGAISAFAADGALLLSFGANGDGPGQFRGAAGLAVLATGEVAVSDAGHGALQIFDGNGNFLRTLGARGAGAGQFTQLQGVAADPDGLLYAADPFQSRVQVFNPDGSFREAIGNYGDAPGRLKTPLGVAYLAGLRRLVVCSANGPRVEVYTAQGAPPPPQGLPPSAPVQVAPAPAAQFLLGAPVVLDVANGSSPQYHPLTYAFEVSRSVPGGGYQVIQLFSVPEGAGETIVDAAAAVPNYGDYVWRCRAEDGPLVSGWTPYRAFSVTKTAMNHLPTIPAALLPSSDGTAALAPILTASNATDADMDRLSYQFEVGLDAAGGFLSLATSPEVAEGAAGQTAWTVPAGVLAPSEHALWRVRAFDGKGYGPWTPYASFWTPAFTLPERGEYGNLPSGDTLRPAEVRYELPPASGDVTLYFDVYNAALSGDLSVVVNGRYTHAVAGQAANDWSATTALQIPAGELNAGAETLVAFVPAAGLGSYGVRRVSLRPPPVPDLRVVAYNTVVDVTWTPWTGDPDVAASLHLYRAFSPDGPFQSWGFYPTGSSLVRDMGLLNDTNYYYRATFVDARGKEWLPSPSVLGRPSAASGGTPVTDLKVARSGSDLILTWSRVTSSSPVDFYEVSTGNLGVFPVANFYSGTLLGVISQTYGGSFVVPGGAATATQDWYTVVPVFLDGTRTP